MDCSLHGLYQYEDKFTRIENMKIVSWSGPPLWSSGQSSWLRNGDVLRFL
jgi:hypothetical protein